MKKIILFLAMPIFVLAGCGTKTDYGNLVNYIYVNECSSKITIRSVIPMEQKDDIEYVFTLPVNGQHTMAISSDGYAPPFWNALGSNEDYVVVSNDVKTITNRLADKDELFLEDCYVLISEQERVRTMEYVFTDDFFTSGEPVQ